MKMTKVSQVFGVRESIFRVQVATFFEKKFVFQCGNGLLASWINALIAIPHTVQAGHLIQGRGNKVLQRNKNYCPTKLNF